MKYVFTIYTILKFILIYSLPICILGVPNNFIVQRQGETLEFSVNCFVTILTFLSGMLLVVLSLK